MYAVDLSMGDVHLKWMPEFISSLLKEVYIALHGNCNRLAMMGVRALLERVMIDRVGDNGSFKGNLSMFATKGYIGELQKATLEATLDAGHAAMHRDYAPSQKESTHVLDIAETLIEAIYVNSAQADVLKKKVPPRKPRTK